MPHSLPTILRSTGVTSPVVGAFCIDIAKSCWRLEIPPALLKSTKYLQLDTILTFEAFLCNPLTGVAPNDIRTATCQSRDWNKVPHRPRSETNAEPEVARRLEG